MNNNLTEIAYILDRSGSMRPLVEPAISGFNRFVREQREEAGDARLTLVLFDDEYLVPHRQVPIEEVPELDGNTYVPRNMTALLDAIGRTIVELGKKLSATPEPERPGQVIVCIFTDGLENASTDFDLEKISEMIKHQREVYKWKFLFLGANQDAIATAAQMGIDRRFSGSVQYSCKGMRSSWGSSSRKVSAMRRHAATGETSADLSSSLQELVNEEETVDDDEL